jgi:HK97 family phage prohead protease
MDELQKVLKTFLGTVKSFDEKNYTVTVTVSTKDNDRQDDEVIPSSFAKRLQYYLAHPVLLSSHSYSSLLRQIGEAIDVKVTDSGLDCTFKYYVGMGNPEADWAWQLVKQKIAAYSIGFYPYDWANKTDEQGYITGRIYTDIELLEVSQVLVPACRQALQARSNAMALETSLLSLAVKAIEEGVLKEMLPHQGKGVASVPQKSTTGNKSAEGTLPSGHHNTSSEQHYSTDVLGDLAKGHKATIETTKVGDAVLDTIKTAFNTPDTKAEV